MDKLCRQLNNGLTILDENELSDKDINNCDNCGELDYYPNLIWDSDELWWSSQYLSNMSAQSKLNALCEECFVQLKGSKK